MRNPAVAWIPLGIEPFGRVAHPAHGEGSHRHAMADDDHMADVVSPVVRSSVTDIDRPLLGVSNDKSQQSQLSSVVRSHEFHSMIWDQPEGCLIGPTITLADVCRIGTGKS